MRKVNILIENDSSKVTVPEGTSLVSLSKNYKSLLKGDILLARKNTEMIPLNTNIYEDCSIEFLDITSPEGLRTYQRTCALVMFAAMYNLYGNTKQAVVRHSANKNFYCQIPGESVTQQTIDEIKGEMERLISNDFPITVIKENVSDCIDIFTEYGLESTANVLRYNHEEVIELYNLNGYYDYSGGVVMPSTGCVKYFDITEKDGNFILQFEDPQNPGNINAPLIYPKLTQIFNEYEDWSEILGIHTVGVLNRKVCNDETRDVILVCEALHEKKISNIADDIARSGRKLVFIAGPSSSGKTTFAKRLGVQLNAAGLTPKVISLDDYYKNRVDIPVDENGQKNFENLEALDVDRFNSDLVEILEGKEVATPLYDFITGNRRRETKNITLTDKNVLLMEGIHGINEALTYKIPREDKYKIYISALTQLNINEHIRISTTDTRLIRRMVRDHYFRGFDAKSTLEMWATVLTGEEKNIFPYQDDTDAIFNSALVYELSVLKSYVEPLLLNISKDDPCYIEARRLLDFLSVFLTIRPEDIPKNSLLREFVGGSIFK